MKIFSAEISEFTRKKTEKEEMLQNACFWLITGVIT
jgi:hypothetical protein